ncbi:hypothetical protein D3C73_1398270 [compost metagenome]
MLAQRDFRQYGKAKSRGYQSLDSIQIIAFKCYLRLKANIRARLHHDFPQYKSLREQNEQIVLQFIQLNRGLTG